MNPTFETIPVDLGDRSYPIHLGSGLLQQVGNFLCDVLGPGRRVLVVSDENVAPLYLEPLTDSLREAGCQVVECTFPAGEGTKSAANLETIWGKAVDARLDRKSVLLALGGGVIGDLTGFAAASFLRGVPFVQVPTSLLAMVDSSVGGKTGINLPQGKNLVGAFHQPALVVMDPDLLKTLPPREFSAGMAEVIKYGIIRDADLFSMLEREQERIVALENEPIMNLVRRSCEIKADVVRVDERESGVRAILNFGHTLGHAIEKVGGYGTRLHGEAISAGMMYAAMLSESRCGFSSQDRERLARLLQAFTLPVSYAEDDWDSLFTAMTADKKAQNAVPYFVLADRVGNAKLPEEVPEEVLHEIFTAWRRREG